MVEQTSVDGAGSQHDSLDAVLASLSNSDRRRIVGLVSDRAPEPVSRGELATALAAWASGKSRSEVTDEERQRAEIALHHQHLPNLSAAGLVECHADDTVALADHPALQNHGILETIEDESQPSPGAPDAGRSRRGRVGENGE